MINTPKERCPGIYDANDSIESDMMAATVVVASSTMRFLSKNGKQWSKAAPGLVFESLDTVPKKTTTRPSFP